MYQNSFVCLHLTKFILHKNIFTTVFVEAQVFLTTIFYLKIYLSGNFAKTLTLLLNLFLLNKLLIGYFWNGFEVLSNLRVFVFFTNLNWSIISWVKLPWLKDYDTFRIFFLLLRWELLSFLNLRIVYILYNIID